MVERNVGPHGGVRKEGSGGNVLFVGKGVGGGLWWVLGLVGVGGVPNGAGGDWVVLW